MLSAKYISEKINNEEIGIALSVSSTNQLSENPRYAKR